MHLVDSKYSCGWIAVAQVTQATVHETGSNLDLHLTCFIAMKSLVSAKGCLQTHFTRYDSVKIRSNITI